MTIKKKEKDTRIAKLCDKKETRKNDKIQYNNGQANKIQKI